jgi:hypothetical protein
MLSKFAENKKKNLIPKRILICLLQHETAASSKGKQLLVTVVETILLL